VASAAAAVVAASAAATVTAATAVAVAATKPSLRACVSKKRGSEIQQRIQAVASSYNKDLAVFFGYNEQLAHRVYASSDLLIMPSRVEPCGLNQLYALKYGTIPVVRKIGGLKDTVIDVEEGGYGFLFDDVDAEEAAGTVSRAVKYLSYADNLTKTRDTAMALDYSWNKSAKKYIELYNQLV
jgi:starch synthase